MVQMNEIAFVSEEAWCLSNTQVVDIFSYFSLMLF